MINRAADKNLITKSSLREQGYGTGFAPRLEIAHISNLARDASCKKSKKSSFYFVHNVIRLTFLLLLVGMSTSAFAATVLLTEGFESPIVTGYVEKKLPDNGKWILATAGFNATKSGIINEDSNAFSNPDPADNQAYAFRYTNSGITTAEGVLATFAGDTTYTVTFQVVKDNGSTGTPSPGVSYNCQLLAIPAGTLRTDCRGVPAGSTLLKSVTGNATSDGLFTTVTLTFISDATLNAADIGKDLAVRFIGATSRAIIDNVRVESEPLASTRVSWASTSQTSGSENGILTVTAQLNTASTQDVTVPFTVSGTASSADYTITTSPLTIPAGSTSADVTISIIDDLIDENNETVILTIGSPTNASAISPITHTATITDNDPAPTIAFNTTSSNGSEAIASVNIPVSITKASEKIVKVNYAVTGGTATGGGTDFTLANGTLTFDPGVTTKNISITIENDALYEGNETFIVTLSGQSNATLGTNKTHTYTINDDDGAPTVAFNTLASNGSEAVTSVLLPVSLSSASSQSVSVDYSVTGGTASGSGTDYTLANGTLTFNPGTTSQNISVTVVNDGLSESDETIIVTLTNPLNVTLGSNKSHTYTINDDDLVVPTVTWTTDVQSSSGESGTMTVTATLSAVTTEIVTIPFSVSGSATGADYSITSSPLIIAAGDTSADVTITITDDLFNEINETVILTMGTPINANKGSPNVHTATITDDDPLPSVAFNASISNGNESVTVVNLPVSLSAASGQTVMVNYAVTGGTASGSGTDFTLANGTLTFNPGTTTQNISVAVVNDLFDENNETIQITLSGPSNATPGTNFAHTYTINDDDPTPTVGFNASSSNNSEAITSVLLPVSISAASGLTVTVDYAVTGGTATGNGTDYTLTSGTLTFTPGTTLQNISLTVVDDGLNEINETIQVTLSSPSNVAISGNLQHTYTIINDDTGLPAVAFNRASSSGNESVSSVQLPVSLSNVSGQTITVEYQVTGGTASSGDYAMSNGILTFPAGTITQNITLAITQDDERESNETVEVTLSNPQNATLGINAVYTYTIYEFSNGSEINPNHCGLGSGIAAFFLIFAVLAMRLQTHKMKRNE